MKTWLVAWKEIYVMMENENKLSLHCGTGATGPG